MKLLEAIEKLSADNMNNVGKICSALDSRLFWLEMREPESDGMVHDAWEEKFDDFQEIVDIAASIKDETDRDEIASLIDELQELVSAYQAIHGGLSRLKL